MRRVGVCVCVCVCGCGCGWGCGVVKKRFTCRSCSCHRESQFLKLEIPLSWVRTSQFEASRLVKLESRWRLLVTISPKYATKLGHLHVWTDLRTVANIMEYVANESVNQISLNEKGRPKCYAKSPTAQDTFWPIPGLVHMESSSKVFTCMCPCPHKRMCHVFVSVCRSLGYQGNQWTLPFHCACLGSLECPLWLLSWN